MPLLLSFQILVLTLRHFVHADPIIRTQGDLMRIFVVRIATKLGFRRTHRPCHVRGGDMAQNEDVSLVTSILNAARQCGCARIVVHRICGLEIDRHDFRRLLKGPGLDADADLSIRNQMIRPGLMWQPGERACARLHNLVCFARDMGEILVTD